MFILNTVAPLVHTVGELWASGRLQIYQEHFVTEQLMLFISTELVRLTEPAASPPVLLVTLPGEQHTLALFMVYALLVSRGTSAIYLGAELPMDQLILAVAQFSAVAVGLTFSGSYSYKHIRPHLLELRSLLPSSVDIWVGGEGVHRLRKLPSGIYKFNTLDKLV